MSGISSISLAFGVVRVVYLATTGRSMVSSTKTLPTSICNDRKSTSVFIFFFTFSSLHILILSGFRFRTNQVLLYLSNPIIHCIRVKFIAILPKDVLIHFESEHRFILIHHELNLISLYAGVVEFALLMHFALFQRF